MLRGIIGKRKKFAEESIALFAQGSNFIGCYAKNHLLSWTCDCDIQTLLFIGVYLLTEAYLSDSWETRGPRHTMVPWEGARGAAIIEL